MTIVLTLAPIIFLIALGAILAHVRFLGQGFMADLNKLVFWIALPALLFRSAAETSGAGAQTVTLILVLLAGTLLVAAAGWLVSWLVGVPVEGRGTFVQASFRANLAFIGIPVMAAAMPPAGAQTTVAPLTTAVVAMAFTMAAYNVLAVVVLQASRRARQRWDRRALVRSIATNPLLLSGLAGVAFAAVGLTVPPALDRTLEVLGGAAVPIALMCIGGSLTFARLDGRGAWISWAAGLKVAGAPALAWALSRAAGLGPLEHRIAVVFSACPTAAAAFIMARQMEGDATLASGSVALSTMLSVVSLTVALWLTG